jgi:prepilin-type N-terminal cleavage/methylation domain-containing protein
MRVKRLQFSNPNHSNQQGFTLVELMLVMSILGLLASISMSEYYYRRKVAFDRQALAVAKNLLTLAATSFANDEVPVDGGGNPIEGLAVGTPPQGYPDLDTNVGIHTYIDKDYDGANAWSFYVASEGGSTAYFFWLPDVGCTLTNLKGYPSDLIVDNTDYNEANDPDEDWRAPGGDLGF